MTVTERIWMKINECGIKPAEIADKTGIDRASFTRWKKKDYRPSIDAIVVLSQFFGVSTDWLLTGEQEIYKPNINIETQNSIVKESNLNETIYADKELSVDEEMLLEAYKNSDRQTKKEILTFITSKTFNCKSLKSKFYNSVNTNEAEDETVAGYELKQLVS